VDKEHCYIFTVSVTAAIYPRSQVQLPPSSFPLGHWAAFTPYTSPLGFAGSYVVVTQSHRPFLCATTFYCVGLLLPKLRSHLAEFLYNSSSLPLGTYPLPPVSVSCTDSFVLFFSWAGFFSLLYFLFFVTLNSFHFFIPGDSPGLSFCFFPLVSYYVLLIILFSSLVYSGFFTAIFFLPVFLFFDSLLTLYSPFLFRLSATD